MVCLTKYNHPEAGEESEGEEDSDKKNDTSSFIAPDLFNGVIGNLAKEIADEIDPKVNLDDPQKLLKSLLR